MSTFCLSNFGWFISDEILLYPFLLGKYFIMLTTWKSIFQTELCCVSQLVWSCYCTCFIVFRILFMTQNITNTSTFDHLWSGQRHKRFGVWSEALAASKRHVFFFFGGEFCWAGRMLEVKTRGAQILFIELVTYWRVMWRENETIDMYTAHVWWYYHYHTCQWFLFPFTPHQKNQVQSLRAGKVYIYLYAYIYVDI